MTHQDWQAVFQDENGTGMDLALLVNATVGNHINSRNGEFSLEELLNDGIENCKLLGITFKFVGIIQMNPL